MSSVHPVVIVGGGTAGSVVAATLAGACDAPLVLVEPGPRTDDDVPRFMDVLAGDVLFFESIGRTDLPGGDFDTLIAAIRRELFNLPDETIVYPGHGPATTIRHEKEYNPFLESV